MPEFRDKRNAEKLLLSFWIANSTKSNDIFGYIRNLRNKKEISREKISEILAQGEKLVDILCYVIMPDHYHLLLKEKKEGGIHKFIHKCNTSVAKYINIKNNRKGPLFESRFKSKYINTNDYLLHLSLYIHLNPLDFLIGKEWRKHSIKNWKNAKEKLLQYPWSSLSHYLRKEDNPIVSGVDIINEQFGEKNDNYEEFLRHWSEEQLNQLEDVIIET